MAAKSVEQARSEIHDKLYQELEDLFRVGNSRDHRMIHRLLMCHLVVEHFVKRYLEEAVPNVRWENISGFDRFSAKIGFARNLKEPTFPDELWHGCKMLNEIRNQLAHDLRIPNIDKSKVGEIRKVLKKQGEDVREGASGMSVITRFTIHFCVSIAYVLGVHKVPGKRKRRKPQTLAELLGPL